MKSEKQVCSLDLAERLKELGVKQGSIFCWVQWKVTHEWLLISYEMWCMDGDPSLKTGAWSNRIAAFTVAELGELLPENVCWRDYTHRAGKWGLDFGDFRAEGDTEADARARMLIYLLENDLMQKQ